MEEPDIETTSHNCPSCSPAAEADRLRRQIAFILEADKEKLILRQNHLRGQERAEDDAEHAWHMALMAYLLREYANDPIDIAKTMLMCLIHDVVEIDAGDTYAYDAAGHADKRSREVAAADRIYALLPADQGRELRGLWEEFERNDTPEARFAHSMDNLQPMLLNDANGGSDWVRHGVRRSQPEVRNDKTRLGSEVLADYAEALLDRNEQKGTLKHG